MKNILRKIWYHTPKSIKNIYWKHKFKKVYGYKYKNNPTTYSNKLMKLAKINKHTEDLSMYTDKMDVKKIATKYGFLTPTTLWSGKTITVDILKRLEKPFIIKTTTMSGDVTLVRKHDDLKKIAKKMNRISKLSYYKMKGENPYKYNHNLIMVEEYLDNDGKSPDDIKVHAFNYGKDLIVSVDYDRTTDHTKNFYDTEGNLINLSMSKKSDSRPFKYGTKLNEIKTKVKKISSIFTYVRVDLYIHDGNLYLGELTFTEGGALGIVKPLDREYSLGKLWKDSEYYVKR